MSILMQLDERAMREAFDSLQKARKKHGPMASAHEGWAVLLEEVEELWDEIKAASGDLLADYFKHRWFADPACFPCGAPGPGTDASSEYRCRFRRLSRVVYGDNAPAVEDAKREEDEP